ncbi:related to major facilitator MirA [Cephalotrichum gorgonifer]|uniref:Related to major facilitator MirA n=1 Tax=Cephalotrichum gorgonifer TaxID=2041049 RepID=A0AAE8SV72_9PEZI|nr:related to major facilitator MirA [Cephalotrichum gorgonifer]
MRFFSHRSMETSATHNNVTISEKQAGEIPDATAPRGNLRSHAQQDQKLVGGDLQDGVAKVEAATIIWTKRDLITAYILIWLIYFITSTEEVTVRALTPFVTSSFGRHSLTATTTIMSSIIAGLSKLPLAKIMDTWGRPQGLALSLALWVLGFIMMATCRNVETYAAAQVFSVTGAQAVSYCITIFVADTSTLKSRGLMLAFATSPYIATTWIGGPISDSLLAGPGWRWGFGIWAIITPVVVLPLIFLFLANQRRAERAGLLDQRSKRAFSARGAVDYLIEVDLLGILILAGGMALFLLPLSLYSYQGREWESPMIIAMLVVGLVLLATFPLYEKFLAPVKFIPLHLLGDRTVLLAGIMIFFVFFSSAIWGSYFNSMLVVVWYQSVTQATYISNIYRVGSCFSGLVIGALIRWSGRFKWVATYFALPLMILGVGLLIHFRLPDQSIGLVIMTQIFVAFSGGPTVIAAEMAMMAPVGRQYVAVIIAILDLFGSMGTAVGSTVAAAIWTGDFKNRLGTHIGDPGTVNKVYQSLYTQLAYKMGDPIREGINLAYGDTQRLMCVASTACLGCAWIASWFWRDIRIKDISQVKGTVV